MAEFIICPNPNCGFKGEPRLQTKGSCLVSGILLAGTVVCMLLWLVARNAIQNFSYDRFPADAGGFREAQPTIRGLISFAEWNFIGMLAFAAATVLYVWIRRGYRCYCPRCGMYCKDSDGRPSQREREADFHRRVIQEAEREDAKERRQEVREHKREERKAKLQAATQAVRQYVQVVLQTADSLPRRVAGEDRFMLVFFRVLLVAAILVCIALFVWLTMRFLPTE